jgi:hypothetical protein
MNLKSVVDWFRVRGFGGWGLGFGVPPLTLTPRAIHDKTEELVPKIHPGHEAVSKALKEKGNPPSVVMKAGFMPDVIRAADLLKKYGVKLSNDPDK